MERRPFNSYMMKNVINSVSFFGYREEDNTILAVFSFDENECSYEESYDNVEKLLKNDMGVNKILFRKRSMNMNRNTLPFHWVLWGDSPHAQS